jgi:hypothetical protein
MLTAFLDRFVCCCCGGGAGASDAASRGRFTTPAGAVGLISTPFDGAGGALPGNGALIGRVPVYSRGVPRSPSRGPEPACRAADRMRRSSEPWPLEEGYGASYGIPGPKLDSVENALTALF